MGKDNIRMGSVITTTTLKFVDAFQYSLVQSIYVFTYLGVNITVLIAWLARRSPNFCCHGVIFFNSKFSFVVSFCNNVKVI